MTGVFDKKILKRTRAALFCLTSIAVIFALSTAVADDRGEALLMLDEWTAIRWGDDNLTWVVHYPEEFVALWVKSEAERQRMRPDQEQGFRKAFMDELRTGSATAVMLSVHAFGQSPLSIAPLSKNIVLIDSLGRRVSPIAFDKKLDGPLNGLVQGFVFFPKQQDEKFSIAVKGLARERETVFSFAGSSGQAAIATAPVAPATRQSAAPRETVVKIPSPETSPPKPPEKPNPPVEEPEYSTEGEVFPPTRAPSPPAPENEPEPLAPPVESTSAPSPDFPKLAPRQVANLFLKAWAAGDSENMYSFLSAESKERISPELFSRDVLSDSFRKGLREGYKIDWSGDSAKITVARRLLFMKTLESKMIKFIEEDGSARVSW
jgi:hypothetical protein